MCIRQPVCYAGDSCAVFFACFAELGVLARNIDLKCQVSRKDAKLRKGKRTHFEADDLL